MSKLIPEVSSTTPLSALLGRRLLGHRLLRGGLLLGLVMLAAALPVAGCGGNGDGASSGPSGDGDGDTGDGDGDLGDGDGDTGDGGDGGDAGDGDGDGTGGDTGDGDGDTAACAEGTWSPTGAPPCEAWTECGEDEIESVWPTPTRDRECVPAENCAEVVSGADAGVGTLREALLGEDTCITFAPDVTLVSLTSTLEIARGVSIRGNGQETTVISGGHTGVDDGVRVFFMNVEDEDVYLSDLAINNGFVAGSLEENTVVAKGGGMLVQGGSTLHLDSVTFEGNHVRAEAALVSQNLLASGGGLYVEDGSRAVVDDCLFKDNSATAESSGFTVSGSGALAGVIFSANVTGGGARFASSQVTGTTFEGNSIAANFSDLTAGNAVSAGATEADASVDFDAWVRGGGAYFYNSTASGSLFTDNTAELVATDLTGGSASGGNPSDASVSPGLMVRSAGVTFDYSTCRGSVVQKNTSTLTLARFQGGTASASGAGRSATAGISPGLQAYGGAEVFYSSAQNCMFSENTTSISIEDLDGGTATGTSSASGYASASAAVSSAGGANFFRSGSFNNLFVGNLIQSDISGVTAGTGSTSAFQSASLTGAAGAAISSVTETDVVVVNSVFWENEVTSTGSVNTTLLYSDLCVPSNVGGGNVITNNAIIDVALATNIPWNVDGNILLSAATPEAHFESPVLGPDADFTPAEGSALIGAGDPSVWDESEAPTDLAGAPRLTAGSVDIGPYQRQ